MSIYVAANDTYLFTKEKDTQTLKSNSCLPERKGREGLGVGVCMCTLMFMEWVVKMVLLYSTKNSTQYSVIPNMGEDAETEWICVYG